VDPSLPCRTKKLTRTGHAFSDIPGGSPCTIRSDRLSPPHGTFSRFRIDFTGASSRWEGRGIAGGSISGLDGARWRLLGREGLVVRRHEMDPSGSSE
jgi:hypothetical protein